VIPENTNAGWTATLGGHRLATRTVDGWQQGYVLPSGAAGVVHLVFAPGTAYRAALGGGALAVLLLLTLLLPGRALPVTAVRRAPGVGLQLVLLAGLVLLGGPVGLVAGLVVGGAARLARSHRHGVLAAIAGLAVTAAGVVLLTAGSSAEPVDQALVLTALAAVAVSLAGSASGRRSGTRLRHRLTGRSRP
jgi:arabinofuranan 3-O-arabinosyltransferase